uniref:F-box domain-containing protein n=1 Tax=Anopheles atroparvus TaxID=41427 RepID=A0A182J6P1_ANOAO
LPNVAPFVRKRGTSLGTQACCRRYRVLSGCSTASWAELNKKHLIIASLFNEAATMSTSILDLPTEVLDHIFDFLPFINRQHAKLVCRRWNQLLSAPRYMKATQLNLTPDFHRRWSADDLLRFASQGKLHSIRLVEASGRGDNFSQESLASIVQLLEAGCYSLEKIQLDGCTDSFLRAVFDALGKMRRMRNLIFFLGEESTELPKIPVTGPEPIGFSFVTNLDLGLTKASCLELVNSLASQLTCVSLHVRVKDLLEQFLNELHLPALHSLALYDYTPDNQGTIEPGALGDGCWRILAQLKTLRIRNNFMFCAVLTEMISHCQNIKHLTLEHCLISMQCMKQIGAFKGLKELYLISYNPWGFIRREGESLLDLPNLEHLSLSLEAKIKFENYGLTGSAR